MMDKRISFVVIREWNEFELQKVTIYFKIQKNNIYSNVVNLIKDLRL